MEAGMKEFDMDSFLPDVAKRFCPQCGTAVPQNEKGRPRKFCSQKCSRRWWATHPKPEHWKSAATVVCQSCGKPFLSTKELYRPRKYCSRACANRGRQKKGSDEVE